ncbi:16S rRNA pseudouridine(516) synthase RsuA [Marinobacter salinexigens]|uniref:Pseudouridine synthase n=1 Tax=Marinobacter salinexigens TaxID=2919747 RepID=A0A5B0VNU9_9GAMM|nr:16S rRNA pseudouridine(516) synthase RsuA [Marinobacter salinexigens]KAA1176392.1 16S rRNA pseudouridine(516) synthase RsuA [Marinobacter salinexigens]
MRLDQYIASCSGLSRKDAKRAIGTGRVSVDGDIAKSANLKVATGSRITLDDQICQLPGERYLMLNKPAGVVSATKDSDHPTVLDLLPRESGKDLHIAGRLDADTTGLVLLTSDGQWSHRVTSPRRHCEKTYRVTLADTLSAEAIQMLEQGVELRNDPQPTKPAQVRVLSERVIELAITEGRYHQVKRMLAAVGNHVEGLHRESIGAISLDPALAPGQYRELTADEISSVE